VGLPNGMPNRASEGLHFEGEDEDISDISPSSNDLDQDGSEEEEDDSDDMESDMGEQRCCAGIARVPLSLLQTTLAMLEMRESGRYECLPRSWMMAVALAFPDIPLSKLRSTDPGLLPPWLLQRFEAYQVEMTTVMCFSRPVG
jgi:hypothetical protein